MNSTRTAPASTDEGPVISLPENSNEATAASDSSESSSSSPQATAKSEEHEDDQDREQTAHVRPPGEKRERGRLDDGAASAQSSSPAAYSTIDLSISHSTGALSSV